MKLSSFLSGLGAKTPPLPIKKYSNRLRQPILYDSFWLKRPNTCLAREHPFVLYWDMRWGLLGHVWVILVTCNNREGQLAYCHRLIFWSVWSLLLYRIFIWIARIKPLNLLWFERFFFLFWLGQGERVSLLRARVPFLLPPKKVTKKCGVGLPP